MTTQERAEEILKKYREVDKRARTLYWEKAQWLSRMKNEDVWQNLFDGAGTWGEFCNNLGVPVSTAQQKIENWSFYITKHRFTVAEVMDLDTSCLYMLARNYPKASKTEIKKFIRVMQTVTRLEFMDMLKEAQTK